MVHGWLGIKHHDMLQMGWSFHGPEHGGEILGESEMWQESEIDW